MEYELHDPHTGRTRRVEVVGEAAVRVKAKRGEVKRPVSGPPPVAPRSAVRTAPPQPPVDIEERRRFMRMLVSDWGAESLVLQLIDAGFFDGARLKKFERG